MPNDQTTAHNEPATQEAGPVTIRSILESNRGSVLTETLIRGLEAQLIEFAEDVANQVRDRTVQSVLEQQAAENKPVEVAQAKTKQSRRRAAETIPHREV